MDHVFDPERMSFCLGMLEAVCDGNTMHMSLGPLKSVAKSLGELGPEKHFAQLCLKSKAGKASAKPDIGQSWRELEEWPEQLREDSHSAWSRNASAVISKHIPPPSGKKPAPVMSLPSLRVLLETIGHPGTWQPMKPKAAGKAACRRLGSPALASRHL